MSSNSKRSTSSNGQLLGVARLVDAHLAQHLADDDLDVLVVDGHALAAVHALDLLDEVALDRLPAAGLEVLLRVDGAVGDGVAGTDLLAVLDQQLGVVGDGVLALHHVLAADRGGPRSVRVRRPRSGARTSSTTPSGLQARDDLVDLDAVALGDAAARGPPAMRSGTSNASRLVTLTRRAPFSPWMISTTPSMWLISALPLGMRASNSSSTRGRPAVMSRPGDTAGVERPHRQLRAGLADRLGGDDADRLADADQLAGRQVAAVAGAAARRSVTGR